MQLIAIDTAKEQMLNWQKLQQAAIPSMMEVFVENPIDKMGEYNRITYLDFGTANKEIAEKIRQVDTSKGDSMNLCLGIKRLDEFDCDAFTLFFEVTLGGEEFYFEAEKYGFDTIISPIDGRFKPHVGVSVEYKNEVCADWATAPFFELNEAFYSTTDMKTQGNGGVEYHVKPRRVRKFILPEDDISAIKGVIESNSHLHVHFGINYSHVVRNMAGFTPVLEVKNIAQGKIGYADGEEDDTYLDFVVPCPPECNPGGNNNN
ncbi:hypothetical protein [Roseivirga pacifica]|uniref:hypothetical protein n=1 Tax=Roseivirga pacifica TaxID=1267423 RepID=UPI003BAB57A3